MRYTDLRANWPPLRLWVIFGILGAGLFAGLFALLYLKKDDLRTPAEELFKERLADLERRWQADTTRMKMVVLGQSLVRAGIAANDSTFKPFLSIYKIWENGAELEDFLARPYLWETLKRLEPGMLLFEETLVAWERPDKKRGWQSYLGLFSRRLRLVLLGSRLESGQVEAAENAPSFDFVNPDHHLQLEDTIHFTPTDWQSRDFRNDRQFHERLAEIGKHVPFGMGILHIPRSAPADSILHSGEQADFLDALTRWYRDRGLKFYWKVDHPPDFSHYRDFAHLNAKGMDWYTRWLIQQHYNYDN